MHAYSLINRLYRAFCLHCIAPPSITVTGVDYQKERVVDSDDVADDDDDDDDLKLDYFYQSESEAAALVACSSAALGAPRPRLCRSAATLPVAPPVDCDDINSSSSSDERRNRFSRSAKERHRRRTMMTMPPSYVEPFVRLPGHGFITARRDKELYTRSTGYIDEL